MIYETIETMKFKLIFAVFCLLTCSVEVVADNLSFTEGESSSLNFKREIDSVFISNSKIAGYQIINRHKVILFAKKKGVAQFSAFDLNGNQIAEKQITVKKNYVNIEQDIRLLYPHSNVSVHRVNDIVVLTGIVDTEEEKDKINFLVGVALGKKDHIYKYKFKEYKGYISNKRYMQKHDFEGVINNIEVAEIKQINVKLTIAEVNHSFVERFGMNLGTGGGTFVKSLTTLSASSIVDLIDTMGVETAGEILAEPNLSVISGESASFLAGGEVPIIVHKDGESIVTYKEYGVRLHLTGKVLRNDKIKITLSPEVSSLELENDQNKTGYAAFKTRRLSTTIQLANGQSFVLAGLLNSEEKESLSRIPFIGDVPILGALFRHTKASRKRQELIVVATVNLVKPIHEKQIQLPTFQKTSTLHRFFNFGKNYDHSGEVFANELLAEGGFRK